MFPTLRFQSFYGSSGKDVGAAMAPSLDNCLYLGGTVGKNGRDVQYCSGDTDAWVVKVDSLGKIIWQRTIGGNADERLTALYAAPDGGVLVSGITNSFLDHPEEGIPLYHADMFACKLKPNGTIEWFKSFGGSKVDLAYDVTSADQNGVVIAGGSFSGDYDIKTKGGVCDGWVQFLDKDGQLKKGIAFGGLKTDFINSISRCKDGGYLLGAYTNSEDIDGVTSRINGDGWLIRINATGEILWTRILSEKYEDVIHKVIELKNGHFFVVGASEVEKMGKQFWWACLDKEGRILKQDRFGGSGQEYLVSAFECKDGKVLAGGYSMYYDLENVNIKGGEDFWMMRIDPEKGVLWQKTFGGPDQERCMAVVETNPGIYYGMGYKVNTFSIPGQNELEDLWLVRVEEAECKDLDPQFLIEPSQHGLTKGQFIRFMNVSPNGRKFLWDFGDGTTSTEKNPTKKFDKSGAYKIRLTVYRTDACFKTFDFPGFLLIY